MVVPAALLAVSVTANDVGVFCLSAEMTAPGSDRTIEVGLPALADVLREGTVIFLALTLPCFLVVTTAPAVSRAAWSQVALSDSVFGLIVLFLACCSRIVVDVMRTLQIAGHGPAGAAGTLGSGVGVGAGGGPCGVDDDVVVVVGVGSPGVPLTPWV